MYGQTGCPRLLLLCVLTSYSCARYAKLWKNIPICRDLNFILTPHSLSPTHIWNELRGFWRSHSYYTVCVCFFFALCCLATVKWYKYVNNCSVASAWSESVARLIQGLRWRVFSQSCRSVGDKIGTFVHTWSCCVICVPLLYFLSFFVWWHF